MNLRTSILFLFILSGTADLHAQKGYSTTDKKAIQYFESAMMSYRRQQFELAGQQFNLAIERDSGFTEAHYEIGLLKAENRDFTGAIQSLKMAVKTGGEKYPEIHFYLGTFLLKTGAYEEAKTNLTKFLSGQTADSVKIKNASRMLRSCEYALSDLVQQVEFNPVNLGPAINSPYSEYYPCLTADDQLMLFTRQIPSIKNLSGQNEEFYVSVKRGGQWIESQNLGPPINSLNNEGAPTLSVDGLLLIFTACALYGDYGPGRKGYGSCDLFFSQKIGSRWSAPQNLGPTVNTRNWETQPSFSSDGRTLYFIRGINTRAGIQDQDIYRTYLSDTGWTAPEKLGPEINTDGREESVFIHPDGRTLYFSSDGHPGFGGYDIFMSKLDSNGKWSEPVNLGYPINTENDENSLMVNANGTIGYFASDRRGGSGGLDLYSFEMPDHARPEKVTFLKGRVFDAISKKPLLAKFELIDLRSGKTVIESYSNSGTGEYLVCLPPNRDYALNSSKKGYMFYSENFTLTVVENSKKPYYKDVPLMPIVEGAKVVLNNIFFETNKYDLKGESIVELKKLLEFMKGNPNVRIEIGGHTDNTGSKELNIELSANRARAVYDYLIRNEIPAERMAFKGYADNEPVASNETIAGRALNRRTEFKIIEIQP